MDISDARLTDEALVTKVTSINTAPLDEVFGDDDYIVAFQGFGIKSELGEAVSPA
jgi:hypothetical protein